MYFVEVILFLIVLSISLANWSTVLAVVLCFLCALSMWSKWLLERQASAEYRRVDHRSLIADNVPKGGFPVWIWLKSKQIASHFKPECESIKTSKKRGDLASRLAHHKRCSIVGNFQFRIWTGLCLRRRQLHYFRTYLIDISGLG